MENLKLSSLEENILKYFEKRPGIDVTVDDIAGYIYDRKDQPKHIRNAVNALLRNLMLKCHILHCGVIHKVTGVGRGNIAVYRFHRK